MVFTPAPKSKNYRSKKYLAFIREHPCLKCGNPEAVAHHEGFGQRGMGLKAPDTFCIPLCAKCHAARHQIGVERFCAGVDVKMRIIELMTEYIERGER